MRQRDYAGSDGDCWAASSSHASFFHDAQERDEEEGHVEVHMTGLSPRLRQSSDGPGSGASSECGGWDINNSLGPPLNIVPKSIPPKELAAYRADYQAFRVGKSHGARGEINSLDTGDRKNSWGSLKPKPYEQLMLQKAKQRKLVPLIGLELASTSAAQSAVAAAGEHRTRSKAAAGDLARPTDVGLPVARASLGTGSRPLSISRAVEQATRSPSMDRGCPSKGHAADSGRTPSKESLRPSVGSKAGLVLLAHVFVSLSCLLPFFSGEPSLRDMLICPLSYALVIFIATLSVARGKGQSPSPRRFTMPLRTALAKVLHMERLIKDGYIPPFFCTLCAMTYGLVVVELALSRTFSTNESQGRRFFLFGNSSLQRYDYACVGSSPLEVADCIIVRHAASSTLLTLFSCLLVACICNRSVQGQEIVAEHRQRLLELFPLEAEALFSYIHASISSNERSWRRNRRYFVQSVGFALGLTALSFSVYASVLLEATSPTAKAAFAIAIPCCYLLQFVLLRYIVLQVLLNLEAIKARAAALAYCDEEGVLPFDSGHAVYVWFSIRRNSHAESEIAYQRVIPVFAATLACGIGCSIWFGSELMAKGLSIFTLTSRGGADLIIIAYMAVSCFLVAVFLQTFMDIGRLEEAHMLQLRVARLRVEHARRYPDLLHGAATGGIEAAPPPHVEAAMDLPSPSNFTCQRSFTANLPACPVVDSAHGKAQPAVAPVQGTAPSSEPQQQDFEAVETMQATQQDLEGASELLELVLPLLEQHTQMPTIFGVEIGQKTFQVINAALTSHAFAVLVWGVMVPSLTTAEDPADVNLVGPRVTTG